MQFRYYADYRSVFFLNFTIKCQTSNKPTYYFKILLIIFSKTIASPLNVIYNSNRTKKQF